MDKKIIVMVRISIALRRRSEIFFDRVWERRFHFRAGPSILLLLFLHVQFTNILDQSLERKEMFSNRTKNIIVSF